MTLLLRLDFKFLFEYIEYDINNFSQSTHCFRSMEGCDLTGC